MMQGNTNPISRNYISAYQLIKTFRKQLQKYYELTGRCTLEEKEISLTLDWIIAEALEAQNSIKQIIYKTDLCHVSVVNGVFKLIDIVGENRIIEVGQYAEVYIRGVGYIVGNINRYGKTSDYYLEYKSVANKINNPILKNGMRVKILSKND